MFVIRPNDPPMQRVLDKLVAAGWVHGSVVIDKAPGSQLAGIHWTPLGKEKLAAILSLIREVERSSFPMSPDEIPFLKSFAELAEMSGSGELPSARRFPPDSQ